MRKLAAFIVLALVPVMALPAAAGSATRLRIPEQFQVAAWNKLGAGLDRISIRAGGPGQEQSVQIARLKADAPYALRAVVSSQAVRGGTETTSSMCRRVKCVAGVNGDFFTTANGQPSGGLSILGQAIRSPNGGAQLQIKGETLSIGSERWNGIITLPDMRTMTLDGVNVPLRGGKISLYTAAWGKKTGNRKGVTEIGVQIIQPKGPLVLGRESMIRFINISHMGDAPIPGDGAVLAAEGAASKVLDALWWQITHKRISPQASITIHSTSPATESIGGGPVLLKDGRRAFTIVPRGLVQGRHPRTVVAWNKLGEIFLVAIDGRQPGYAQGMSLLETTSFLLSMGATDAINLDGGGSTTFVQHGRVVNRPSDPVYAPVSGKRSARSGKAAAPRVIGHRERAVANALMIVPAPKPKKAVKPAPVPKPKGTVWGTRFMPIPDEPAVLAVGGRSSPLSLPGRPQSIGLATLMATTVAAAHVVRRRRLRASRTW